MALTNSGNVKLVPRKPLPNSQIEPQRRSPAPPVALQSDKLPPSSLESEKGVLGSILQDSKTTIPIAYRSLPVGYFYDPTHRTLYDVLLSMWKEGTPVDLITFTQTLGDRGLLQRVGGPGYVTQLFTFVPSAVNIESYITTIREKFLLREIINTGNKMVRSAYGAEDLEVGSLIEDFSRTLERMKSSAGGPNGSVKFEFSSLMAFDPKHDPNCLVGNRYLVRGGSSLWAGGSGYGKSSLGLQLAVHWAAGVKCFGLRPVRPLKSLVIQAENDEGDMGEQLQGVITGVSAAGEVDVQECGSLIEKNVGIHRVVGRSGLAFLSLLEMLVDIDRPDIVWIDPLFAFAGCDLMNAEKTGRFLREGLFSFSAKKNVALNVIHHVGKPVRDSKQDGQPRLEIDYQYLGFGTSEIQNAFRAVNILVPISDSGGMFRLVLSKRGERAGASDIEGRWARSVYLKHSTEGICWLQCEEPKKQGKEAALKYTNEDVLSQMGQVGWKTESLQEHLQKEIGMSRRTFYRLWDELKKQEKVSVTEDKKWVKNQLDFI